MQNKNDSHHMSQGRINVRTLTSCALFCAASIILSRLIIPMPNATTRFSLEAIPYFLSGMLFGPLAGALVGGVSDIVGCLFSGYGFNPLFSLPPILYGLISGIFGRFVKKKPTFLRIGLVFLIPVLFGSVLYQSWALAFVYGGKAFKSFFVTKLLTRSVQFAVTWVLETTVVYMLIKAKVFEKAHIVSCSKTEKSRQERNIVK